MKTKHILALLLSIVILSSCVSVKTTSYSDPDFINKAYTRFCIFSTETNFNRKKMIENYMVKVFMDNYIDAVPGALLFPPTREWTESEFHNILIKNEIDAFIRVTVEKESINTWTTPVVSTNVYSVEREDEEGNKYYEEIEETRVSEDVNAVQENHLTASLIDVQSDRIAWKSFSESSINLRIASFESAVKKYAKNILEELKNKNHIKSK